MGKCPFLRTGTLYGSFQINEDYLNPAIMNKPGCISPDNPGISFVRRHPYELKTTFGVETDKCYSGRSSSCHYNFDQNNREKYGPNAPRYFEKIWVSPSIVSNALIGSSLVISGRVIEKNWPPEDTKQVIPLLELKKIKYSIKRWRESVDWDNTGAHELLLSAIDKKGLYDGCNDEIEVRKRFNNLDFIFKQVKKEHRLRSSQELYLGAFREEWGILVHLGPDKELYIGGGGVHRFAIAYVLGLPIIPSKIGYVHKNALPYLDQLRY